jgi:hypothetical protein
MPVVSPSCALDITVLLRVAELLIPATIVSFPSLITWLSTSTLNAYWVGLGQFLPSFPMIESYPSKVFSLPTGLARYVQCWVDLAFVIFDYRIAEPCSI